MPGVVYLTAWLVVVLCTHFYSLFFVPFLPPPAIFQPTYPSLCLLLPSSLLSPSPRIGALSVLVRASSLWWFAIDALVMCDITVCDRMFEFGISDGNLRRWGSRWYSLTWDYVAVNRMACRVSALGACRCVSHRVPFLAARHASDMRWHAFRRFDVPSLFLVLLSIVLLPSLSECQLDWYPDLPLEPVGFHMFKSCDTVTLEMGWVSEPLRSQPLYPFSYSASSCEVWLDGLTCS